MRRLAKPFRRVRLTSSPFDFSLVAGLSNLGRDADLTTSAPAVAVALLVRELIATIVAAARDIDARDQHDLGRLNDQALLVGGGGGGRLFRGAESPVRRRAATLAVECSFIGDAAHELRTPMTAIALQAERLAKASMSDEARARSAALREESGAERTCWISCSSLARTCLPPLPDSQGLSVRAELRRVLEDMVPIAVTKAIVIGVVERRGRARPAGRS